MTSVPQQAEAVQRILEEEAVRLAFDSGFIQRERAFNGADFAQALILGWLQRPDERLEGFTQILQRRAREHHGLRAVSAVYKRGSHLHAAAHGTGMASTLMCDVEELS
jgi:membrane-bound lytic murein transglycosylase MltF